MLQVPLLPINAGRGSICPLTELVHLPVKCLSCPPRHVPSTVLAYMPKPATGSGFSCSMWTELQEAGTTCLGASPLQVEVARPAASRKAPSWMGTAWPNPVRPCVELQSV